MALKTGVTERKPGTSWWQEEGCLTTLIIPLRLTMSMAVLRYRQINLAEVVLIFASEFKFLKMCWMKPILSIWHLLIP